LRPVAALALVAAGMLGACSPAVPTSPPASTPLTFPLPTARPTLPPPVPDQAGFGSIDAAWEATHRVDSRSAAGTAYDPTPGLGPDDSRDDAYFLVVHRAGRVISYTERIANGSTIAEARRAALNELPGDVKLLWFATRTTCAQEELRSTALAKILGALDPTGDVFVEFSTGTATGDAGYAANDANQVFFSTVVAMREADAPEC